MSTGRSAGDGEHLRRLAGILAGEAEYLLAGDHAHALRGLALQTADTLDVVSAILRRYGETGHLAFVDTDAEPAAAAASTAGGDEEPRTGEVGYSEIVVDDARSAGAPREWDDPTDIAVERG